MTKDYQPDQIEPKWQRIWQEEKTYQVELKGAKKPTFYGFGMFNYPSGDGIHVGHVKNFTLPDVLCRFYRQQGYSVYSPVGFDSFGLPAENFALKTGAPPRQTTDQVIANYRQQYQALGFSFDWSKEIDTSQIDYYRWTQWCFLQLHQAGLAYQKENRQWWCQACQTVLADEQVIGGKCWRHDGRDDPVIGKKTLKQWFFKITALADEILAATDDLDWTPWVKTAQKNYIGRSTGLKVDFALTGLGLTNQQLTVYTTAIDTVLAASFMVLAPEHPLVEQIADQATNQTQIKDYLKLAASRNQIQRQQAKDKTGVVVEGLWAQHPLLDRRLPVWIADYVLADYGTGSIMAVPGADDRDRQFADQHQLEIIYPTTTGKFVDYPVISLDPDSYQIQLPAESLGQLGGKLQGQSMAQAKVILGDHFIANQLGQKTVNYRLHDWLISRQRYWGAPIPIIHCQDCGAQPVPAANLPVELPPIDDYRPTGDGQSPLAKVTDWVQAPCPQCQRPGRRETDTMDSYVCSSWYQFRYLSANDNSQAWDDQIAQKWLPVNFYNGADHATAHLIYARFFSRFFHQQGLVPTPEPFAKMYLHAKILAPDGRPFSKSKGNGIDPLEIIDQGYGADALRVYVCFMAPPDIETSWNHNGVPAAFRFLSRCATLVAKFNPPPTNNQSIINLQTQLLRATHRCIQAQNRDLKRLKLNTALAALMEFVNQLYKLWAQDDQFQSDGWSETFDSLVMLLAPFAPHLASELWQQLGHTDSVHVDNWPQFKSEHIQTNQITIAILINGRRRAELTLTKDQKQHQVQEKALQLPVVQKHLKGKSIKRVVYVAGKVLNLVV